VNDTWPCIGWHQPVGSIHPRTTISMGMCSCVIVFAMTTDVADTMVSFLDRLDSLIDNIMIDYYV
jgi:hypothetical protein